MSRAEIPEFVNVDDYLAMEERALTKSEYVDGWVRAMTWANDEFELVFQILWSK